MQSFGSYVRQLRKAKRLGLREASEKIGITPSYLSRIENSRTAPPMGAVIHAMAKLYSVPPQDLIERVGAKQMLDATTAADEALAPFMATFYRLAAGRAHSERIEMLRAALNELQLPPDKQEWWMRELSKLDEDEDDETQGLHRIVRGFNDLYDLLAVPRPIRAQTIEQMAQIRLMEYFGNLSKYKPPTPIEEIIESEDEIDFAVFGDEIGIPLPNGAPAVLGRCRWNFEKRREVSVHESLFDRDSIPAYRRGRFTMAHEYFHAIEHLPRMSSVSGDASLNRVAQFQTVTDGLIRRVISPTGARKKRTLKSNEDWREFQANTFAAAILMPAFAVREVFLRLFGCERVTGQI